LGTDSAGEHLTQLCRENRIEFISVSDGRPTLRKARVVAQHQQLVRLDFEENRAIDADTETRVLALVMDRLSACDIAVLSDYAKGLLTSRICQQVIHEAHRLGKQVVVDPRPEHREFYIDCDYLTPNWKESLGLLGQSYQAPAADHIEATGRSIVQAIGTNLLLTLGAHGMAFFARDGQERFSVATEAREVFDVSGAGDTVVAAFALARATGASHHRAVMLANRAAGIVVAKLGTATVTPAELMHPDQYAGRVVLRRDLAALCAALRAKGKRIVTVNGSFDLLHAGHLHILNQARRQGDALIVGLNADVSVTAHKGPGRPIVPQHQRTEMLLALRYVDYVHVFDELTPNAFLSEVRPDVHVNGTEYGEDCIEAPIVKRHGGRIHLVDRIDGSSSSLLRERLAALRGTAKVPQDDFAALVMSDW
jgi:D-beta-D-heptose 7-phosphate kinase/D-beta-D-heptose 1-phosphate adenosyltransferase